MDAPGDRWMRMVHAARRARIESAIGAPLAAQQYWYVFHQLIVPPPRGYVDGVFACRELTCADEHLIGEFARPRWRDELTTWLDDPDVTFLVAFHAGRAVAYECVSRRLPVARPFRALRLADDELWVRDTYALPGYRARGAIRALRAYRNRVMGPLGFCGTVTAVAEDCPAVLAATYDRLTWKVEGLAYHRVLAFGRTRVEPDAQARLERRLRVARARRRRAAAAVIEPMPAAA